jgi:NAD(P)-dependent dehydrogenase (short-subunit alcohol dehydrogenase family)
MMNGKVVIVTGANNGIGFHAAQSFAQQGSETVLAVRNVDKGQHAAERIQKSYPQAKVDVMQLDLADLASVHTFANLFREKYSHLSILVNNAGVMIPPYQKTKDGFELQLGSNHLGHFALTGLLLPLLTTTEASRVVSVSSLASKNGRIMFDNLDGSKGYQAITFYCQSKLANFLFANELQRRLAERQLPTISLTCHPGIANTNLMSRGSGKDVNRFMRWVGGLFLQSAEMGSLPIVYAATNDKLQGGEFIGPDGRGGRRGLPTIDNSFQKLWDEQTATRLWDISEALTGVKMFTP